MMFDIGEDDAYLYPDGKPRHVILKVGTRNLIMPTDRTIADLVSIISSFVKSGVNVLPSSPTLSNTESFPPAGMNIPQETNQTPLRNDTIQMFDIVKYTGPQNDDNLDLVPGRLYRVLDVSKNQYSIIDDKSDFPIRLAVWKNMVELVTKHDPALLNKKTVVFDILFSCICGSVTGLIQSETGAYRGKCPGCKKELLVHKEDVAKQKSHSVEGDGVMNKDIDPHNPKVVLKTR